MVKNITLNKYDNILSDKQKNTLRSLIKSRLAKGIREIGHIKMDIALALIKDTLREHKIRTTREFIYKHYNPGSFFPVIYYRKCSLCGYISDDSSMYVTHTDFFTATECKQNILRGEKLLINMWETANPVSPSKIRPSWWDKEYKYLVNE